jgi:hypothetical protein
MNIKDIESFEKLNSISLTESAGICKRILEETMNNSEPKRLTSTQMEIIDELHEIQLPSNFVRHFSTER